jgi:hypothetical protein
VNIDGLDWDKVIAILNERFPRELEIAILHSRLQQSAEKEGNDDRPDSVD